MLCEVLKIDDAAVKKLLGMYDTQMADLTNYFVDNMTDEIKADTIMLVCALASVDEKISAEETAFIRKLFE